jgi:hypothetical protein
MDLARWNVLMILTSNFSRVEEMEAQLRCINRTHRDDERKFSSCNEDIKKWTCWAWWWMPIVLSARGG